MTAVANTISGDEMLGAKSAPISGDEMLGHVTPAVFNAPGPSTHAVSATDNPLGAFSAGIQHQGQINESNLPSSSVGQAVGQVPSYMLQNIKDSLNAAANTTAKSTTGALGLASEFINPDSDVLDKQAIQDQLSQAGKAADQVYPVQGDPLVTKGSSMVAGLAPAFLPGAQVTLPALMGGGAYQNAVESGADRTTASNAGLGNAAVAAAASLIPHPQLDGATMLGKGAARGLQGAATGIGLQAGANLVDKATYDPNRNVTEGLTGAGAVGGILGAAGGLAEPKSPPKETSNAIPVPQAAEPVNARPVEQPVREAGHEPAPAEPVRQTGNNFRSDRHLIPDEFQAEGVSRPTRPQEEIPKVQEPAKAKPQAGQLQGDRGGADEQVKPALSDADRFAKANPENQQKLSNFSDTMHSENNAEKAARMLDSRGFMGTNDKVFASNDPELALGQGENKGVKIEFDASKLKGSLDTSKPTAEALRTQGKGEFQVGDNPAAISRAAKAVTVNPSEAGSRLPRLLGTLQREGFTEATKNQDGTTTYRRPGKTVESAESTVPKETALSAGIAPPGGGTPNPLSTGPNSSYSLRDITSGVQGMFERLRPMGNKYGDPIAYDFTRALTTPKESSTAAAEFMKRSGLADNLAAGKDFIDYADHFRAKLEKARGGNPTGVQELNPQELARIQADPAVQKAVDLWNKEYAPKIDAIRTRAGMPMDPRAKTVPLFLNEPGERGPSSPRTDNSVNTNKAFNSKFTGEGEYIKDPQKRVEAILGQHMKAEAMQNLVENIRANHMVDPATVQAKKTTSGHDAYLDAHGNQLSIIDDLNNGLTNNDPARLPEPVFVPKKIGDVWNNVRQGGEKTEWDTLFDRALQKATKVAVVGDVAPHTLRLSGRVGAAIGQSGESWINSIPWLGKHVGAAREMLSMKGTPQGEFYQRLVDRIGADRGRGWALPEGSSKSHEFLFNKDSGVDVLGRRAVAKAHAIQAIGLGEMNSIHEALGNGSMTTDEAVDRVERTLGAKGMLEMGRSVNNTLGWANTQTRTSLLNNISRVDPFVTAHTMRPGEIMTRATLNLNPKVVYDAASRGEYGQALKAASGQLATGAVGTWLVKNLINYATTKMSNGQGNWMHENPEDHRNDVHLLNSHGKDWYFSTLDPSDETAARLMGQRGSELGPNNRGGALGSEASINPRAAGVALVNDQTGHLSTAIRMAAQLATGRTSYLDEYGNSRLANPGDYYPASAGRETAKYAFEHRPFVLKNDSEGLTKEKTNLPDALAKDAANTLTGQRLKTDSPDQAEARHYAKLVEFANNLNEKGRAQGYEAKGDKLQFFKSEMDKAGIDGRDYKTVLKQLGFKVR